MADYKLVAVLSTGKPGVPNTTNYGTIPKLKVSDTLDVTNNITVGGTVDGVDIATRDGVLTTLNTNFGTHDGDTAKAQHTALGDHAHTGAGAEAGQLSHATAFSAYGTGDHTEHPLLDGTRAFTGTQSGITPTADAHLATKGYADALLEGLPNKYACRVRAQGNINISAPGASIDGVTMAVDDRFLADQQSTGSEDGIYLWKGAAVPAVRADDYPAGFNARGSYCFIEEGTNADDGFVCTNDKGSDVVGTDDLTFIQFSGAGQITAGTGLTKTGNTINAIGGDGIAAAADSLAVDLHATNPGLEIDTAQLRIKIDANKGLVLGSGGISAVPDTTAGMSVGASGLAVDLATAGAGTGGLEFDGSGDIQVKTGGAKGITLTTTGLEVEIDPAPGSQSNAHLEVDGDGLRVKGLPPLFEIDDTAVGSGVTAANLTELTDGSSSTLHTHAVASHAIGGASHSTDTKANFNSKISDLIATYGAFRDIGVGTDAQRPAAGTAGRFWWATDSDKLYYDNGATWDTIVASPSVHDLDGSEHGTCTISELSGKLTDDTLLGQLDVDDSPVDGVTTAPISSNWAYDHVNDADQHAEYQKESEKGAASGYASLSAGTLVVEDPANATATPTADKIVIAEGDGKIAAGWIDTGDITGSSLTWSGDQHFNGETTVDELIGDGNYAGIQIPCTVGTGGITAGDIVKFDGSAQIVRRSGADDIAAGIAASTTAASSTGYFVPIGVAAALFTSGQEPSSAGQNVFNDNTPSNYHKLTTTVQTDGIVYSAVAIETGAGAKVIWVSRRVLAFEN